MIANLKPYPEYKDSGIEWLGEIPVYWQVLKLKRICSLAYGDSLASDARADGEVEVYGSNGPVGLHDQANTLAPCLVIGRKGSYGKVNYSVRPVFAIDTTFFVDRRLTRVDLRWLYYALTDARLDSATKDSAIPGLDREDAYARVVCVPSEPEQHAIAGFLDRETAKIDALVGKKERLIELLQEKRTALITHAVTKGLDPDVPMKDSGIEWLGQIPAHWEVWKLKHLAQVKRGASPRPIDDPIYFDDEGEYSWVRIGDLTASERYLERTTQRLSKLGQSKSVRLELGSLFVSIAASVGKPIITRIKCCIHDGFVYFEGLRPNAEFVWYLLQCGEAYKGLGKLGTQLNLNTDTVGEISIPLPDSAEQQSLVNFLDRETAKIDALITKIGEAIERLREYRTALISAAVTGKIDVRGLVEDREAGIE
jgi:type I restriction enzyme S subunit